MNSHHQKYDPPPSPRFLLNHHGHSQPAIPDSHSSLPEVIFFHGSSDSTPSSSSDGRSPTRSSASAYIDPEPHISSQFYTFNAESHALMIRCILDRRLACPDEIRVVTSRSILNSWRTVWKDRNEDTAYVTGWKRIQEKLTVNADPASGNEFLCFKNNSQQFVSHVNQWQDIVMGIHGDADFKHPGVKETIERIKQVWTVGAKFYGIPESYIRVCVAACTLCSASDVSGLRNKRRRFMYTESFDVPAKEVPNTLQHLAAKHKVVLCIRQKYIRYKPFMAEVKDYACHRAGEPVAKKPKILKREPYASKRCGCGFRIRAIVPITNYNEKDKTFVYQEEGMAVFKLYAVHSGHEPGPLDGNARIMHRLLGHKGSLLMDQEIFYGVHEDVDVEGVELIGNHETKSHLSVLQQMQELKSEIGFLEGRLRKFPHVLLSSISQELFDIVNKVRRVGEECTKSMEFLSNGPHTSDVLLEENELVQWDNQNQEPIYGSEKETCLLDDDEDCFRRTLGDVVNWDQMRNECRIQRDLISESCKEEKWLRCTDFDEKSLLVREDAKPTRPMRHDDAVVSDLGHVQVDCFYQDNSKWYDSPCGLDPSIDCGDIGFQH